MVQMLTPVHLVSSTHAESERAIKTSIIVEMNV